jgi:hypothetical protein
LNSFEETRNNENQPAIPWDPLHVSIEPITRTRVKRIK